MRNAPVRELTNEQVLRLAPAAGAQNPFSAVSARYSFVPTIAAVDLLRDAGWVPVSARQTRVRKAEREGFQRHVIRFQKAGLAMSDQERVDLVLYNSHDRGSAFKLCASIWRKICGNGLMVASELLSFSHRHLGFDPEAFMDSAKTIAGSAGVVAEKVDQLKAIELTPEERGVFAGAAHRLVYDDPEKAPITPKQLLTERRYDDKGNDLWTAYNIVQENFQKGGLRGIKKDKTGRRRIVRTRPIMAIDRDRRLNEALWVLTEEMARLVSK